MNNNTKTKIIMLVAVLCIAAVATPVVAGEWQYGVIHTEIEYAVLISPLPPIPFLIDGWVNCTNGDPVNDPSVTVTNLNTSEVFIAETSSNYYRVLTSSYNVSAGNVLHFNVSNSDSIEFDHTITEAEMCAGGFTQNATIECGPAGTCGDVDGQNGVTMGDAIQVAMSTIYGTEKYPLADPWAADVDCQNGVTMGDAIQIAMSTIYGTTKYPLECC